MTIPLITDISQPHAFKVTPGQKRSMRPGCKTIVAGLMLALLGLLSGCSSYRLAGTVIQGPQAAVLVVSKDDPRLDRPGVEGATLEFTIDPDSLNAHKLPMDITDEAGKFSSPVNEPGAGFLEYELLVLCRAEGYRPASNTLMLPSGGKRLLIIVTPGDDAYKHKGDIVDETIDMGHQLAPGK